MLGWLAAGNAKGDGRREKKSKGSLGLVNPSTTSLIWERQGSGMVDNNLAAIQVIKKSSLKQGTGERGEFRRKLEVRA